MGYSLNTVDIALTESLNALWKHAKISKDIDEKEVKPIMEDLSRIFDSLTIVTTMELIKDATTIALIQNITIYDSLYIAAARKLNSTLYTADKKLYSISERLVSSKLLKF